MARPINLSPLPDHPALGKKVEIRMMYGHQSPCVSVTCPHCNAVRWYTLGVLRQQLARCNFNGQCRPCSAKMTRAGFYRWAHKRNPNRKGFLSTAGYTIISPTFVDDTDLPLFRQCHQNTKVSWVLGHRWAMAKLLGRPLKSNECVDHMDGNKTNNDPSNLRIYVKGKNQPGSNPGHGTYYHEWQLALARIRELEAS